MITLTHLPENGVRQLTTVFFAEGPPGGGSGGGKKKAGKKKAAKKKAGKRAKPKK